MFRIFVISVFLLFSNLAYGGYISFLDQKSEAIISKYLGKKFLVGKANYSFLFWIDLRKFMEFFAPTILANLIKLVIFSGPVIPT